MFRLPGGTAAARGLSLCLLLAQAGCSALALRLPPTEPSKRKQALERCMKPWSYPIVDTGSVIAGTTWLLGGFRDRDQSTDKGGSSRSWANAETAFGYSVMGLYGASAIYGYYVVAKCRDLERAEKAKAAERAASLAVRYQFPQKVLGYSFGQTTVEAQRVCESAHGAWDAAMERPVCHAATPSLKQPDVRFELSLGTVQRITLVYPASRATFDRALRDVQQTALHYYGPPQQPPGTWRWAGGSIQLESFNTEDRSAVELSFERTLAE
jgi:hypothetical protein